MPRSRRSAQNARQGAQSTLSFGTQSRVRKPTLPIHLAKKQAEPLLRDQSPSTVEREPKTERTTADVAIQDQSKKEVRTVTRSREKELAAQISETQLKRYWKAREAERTAARVHQEDLTMSEKILRHFDLSSQYGPCVGIPRMKRWARANKLSLHPPIEVLAVLLSEEEKGNPKSQRAHIDELISSRFVTE